MTITLYYFTSTVLASAITSASTVHLQPEVEYLRLCPSSSLEVTCTSLTANILWRSSSVPGAAIVFNAGTVGDRILGDLLLVLVSKNPLKSIAALSIVESHHNGTTLSCASTLSGSPSPEQIANITILVKGPPSAPLSPGFFPQSFTSVFLSWIPPSDDPLCVSCYTITLTNITEGNISIVYITFSNTTSKMVVDLIQGLHYSFTVAGVDAGGRVGEKSVPAAVITLDTPEAVHDLSSSTTNDVITITWMPPPPSSRPPVTGYKISHNTTGSVFVNQTSETELAVACVVPGVYLFTALAVNILGDGEVQSITGLMQYSTKFTYTSLTTIHVCILIFPTTVVLYSTKSTAVAVTTTIASEILGGSTMMIYNHSPSPVMTLRQNLILPSSTLYNTKATQMSKKLSNITVPVIITSVSIITIIITALVIVITIFTIAKRKFAGSSQAVSMSPQDNLTCSENVAYDTVSNTLKMSTQVNMTCSENIAYATVGQTSEDSMRNTTTSASHTAVYDEVLLRKC